MSKNTGGPVFPAPAGVQHITEQGMTLRDYFAAKVMQGILANGARNHITASGENLGVNLFRIAPVAYEIADAMLKAREAR